MFLSITSSGLAGLAADAREFLAAVRFARPEALWLLLLLPVLGLVNRWGARRRRAAVARIGRPAAVAGQLTHPVPRRKWLGLAYPLGWVALVLGLAGPRWGKSDETGVAVGRDLVVVIDLSRSMQADDVNPPADGWRAGSAKGRREPTRWRAARDGALDLIDGVARRGGHRVAVVVFAARPKLLCPLTTDYDHVRAVLEEIDGDYPPHEIRPAARPVEEEPKGVEPEPNSGTRIGAGLKAAVDAHDKRFPGYQDIILISDGDDPGDDKEWVKGSDKAREAGIPVHTVGVGNPDAPAVLVLGPELVSTQLQEGPLKQIAAETRGRYIAARKEPPRLGEFFRAHLEPLPSREVSDESIPLPKERYPWFLAPALAFFAVGWLRGK
jgi:Ca-activated chloride channel family protein